ncbi:aminotransferase class V-fold PLP-dependent enzyme [Pyxidicoccus fallax]|uniref:Aminotransferase class V-fold PLP-dependent enzyme n=1 Tax=Pyxidicoccus fallax TaxID=394095 RepID=A0A848LXD0_9BACT|nr:aminotransferase class V-fold PLP-dependent enzyme [Pyxidicoccus fallax]NMO21914.1 aminotransferase class V-fold PLP-dependent enzyme [Pyxidicoccus fallax]NPC84461.1 aminotransferase class V-fold PLP-dependent enzyme [Pyxidicoccus fallax]
MSIDVTRARAETPGTAHVAHFNNAGASLPAQPVLDAVMEHLQREARIGGYEAEDAARDRLERVYDSIGMLLNASRDEVAVVENATVAWDMAFYGLAQDFRPGDRILTGVAEYAANYVAYLQVARRTGAVVEVVPNDAHGQLSISALESMMDSRVRLISVTHIPTNGGLVNPAAAIGRVARRAGVPFLLDACQTVGQLPVDVEALGCDLLSATGRKFLRAPRGTGFLYVRKALLERLEPPMLDHHAAPWTSVEGYTLRPDARRFENWENNIAAKLGLGVAVDYALGWGLDAIWERVRGLAERLRARLADLPGVTVRDVGEVKCGIVTFTVEGQSPDALRQQLLAQGINVSVTRRPSTRLDMEARGLGEMVRASVHYYNTEEELERLVDAVVRTSS